MRRERWDIARGPMRCAECAQALGAGEQIRHYGKGVVCPSCAERLLAELAPVDMPAIPDVPSLKPPARFAADPPLMSTRQRARVCAAGRRLGIAP